MAPTTPNAKEPMKREARPRTAPPAPVSARPAAAAYPAAHPARPAAAHAATSRPAPHAAAATHHAPHLAPTGRYAEAVGRRKTAVARVRLFAGSGKVTVNGKEPKIYFNLPRLLSAALSPLSQINLAKQFDITIAVRGGGISAQAEAVRHGISRAIVEHTPDWKPRLRAMGWLTRDSRMVERKKYGLKKARRAPQWAKR